MKEAAEARQVRRYVRGLSETARLQVAAPAREPIPFAEEPPRKPMGVPNAADGQ
jgi:hypothetical protein